MTVMKLKPMFTNGSIGIRQQLKDPPFFKIRDQMQISGKNYYSNSANESINKYLKMETNRKSAVFDNR